MTDEVEVHAFGLLTDFASRLFPGSQRLLELADRRQEQQVVVGDLDASTVAYEALCRRHFRAGTTRVGADLLAATVGASPAAPVASELTAPATT